MLVRDLSEKGYRIFLAGEKNHGEVIGIQGYCKNEGCIIAGNRNEADAGAEELKKKAPGAKTALLAQTTFSEDEYRKITEAIKRHFPDLEVKNTICGATRDRQDSLRKLCAEADAVIVAGGKDSANTRRLLAIAEDCGKPAFLAESAADLAGLPAAFHGDVTIGLCAGASTPDEVIDEIEQKLFAM
jgi:4-hydroxy-3-methylbut-2-enyl diphosphate reductase